MGNGCCNINSQKVMLYYFIYPSSSSSIIFINHHLSSSSPIIIIYSNKRNINSQKVMRSINFCKLILQQLCSLFTCGYKTKTHGDSRDEYEFVVAKNLSELTQFEIPRFPIQNSKVSRNSVELKGLKRHISGTPSSEVEMSLYLMLGR